ncbi:MAG: hypothetical protein KDI63_01925 [Gammaproteobacteria bacterium]|nr:hypothetical protein [Gammaproteobacteria bacterium]
MDDGFEHRFQSLKAWIDEALETGWITQQDAYPIEEIEQQQAAALFAQRGKRPLIVAFFGGTGVGKSSLLNRLAGAEIASVGLQRPTSSEVTLYLHQEYRLGELPAELPLEETRVAYHGDNRRRLVAWLDMPDFDSVEERHRELVKLWLPYIDWLVYVVSPGRYLDDIGWRFLQQRGNLHSWLFIINQWDQGSPDQVSHLRARLKDEGFPNPVILRTSCHPSGAAVTDDFHLLEQTINGAIEQYGIEWLQQLGTDARLRELYHLSDRLLDRLRSYSLDEGVSAWEALLVKRLDEFEVQLSNNAALLVQTIPNEEGLIPWRRSKEPKPPPLAPLADLVGEVWGERMDTRTRDLTNELENLIVGRHLPLAPFSKALEPIRAGVKASFLNRAESELAISLSQPDGNLKSLAYKIAGQLSWLLPTAAAGWAIYHAVIGFYAGTQGQGDFLGVDFAVHSALLIGLSWLLPWLLQRRMKPRVAEKMNRAFKRAIQAGIQAIKKQGSDGVRLAATEHRSQISRLLSVQQGLALSRADATVASPWSRLPGN